MTDNPNLTFADEAVHLIEVVSDRQTSSTQATKTLIIEKNSKKYIAFSKMVERIRKQTVAGR
ncbi:hypothetical protein D7Z26_16435 [Cohnella endophytica]|uniref:Uncharacterized protein n=1 Tax=Cohnella endophytica TaxID=2419778 RepID=A0A494XTD0_9BACL|nr:hypothetical protein D7Z26_16435 [Cohnella endophytica]